MGGGVETTNASSFKTSKIFKPIIATTLALSLGASSYGVEMPVDAANIMGTGNMEMDPVKVVDTKLNEMPDQNLTIRFNTTANSNDGTKNISYDSDTRTVTYYNDSSMPNITANGYSYFQLDDKASMDSMFNYGTGTLTVDLATGLANQSLVYTLNGKENWIGNITGMFGATGDPGNTGAGGRHLNINLEKNYTGDIKIIQSSLGNVNSTFFQSNIKLGNGTNAATFMGNLMLSSGGNTVDIKGMSGSNYKFQGIMTLSGGTNTTNTINLENVDLYTKDMGNMAMTYDKNSAPIVIQGGTNTLNFKNSVNIYGQIYTTGGTNTFKAENTAATGFYMAGDINARGGTNVFVFKNDSITPVLAGNINVSGGRTTILFDNTAWLSASYKNDADKALQTTYADKFLNLKDIDSNTPIDPSNGEDKLSSLTGNLMVTGGSADVIFKYNKEMTQGDKNITYNVTTANSNAGANIILDTADLYTSGNTTPLTLITNLKYAGQMVAGQYIWTGAGNGNAINLFFTQGHNGNDYGSTNTVSFNSGADQTFLGATPTNGLRLEFKDKNIAVKGSPNVSFIAVYKDAILNKVNKDGHKTDLLSVKFETGKEMNTSAHTNTITLTGVAVGDIYALKSLNGSGTNKTSTYNLVVDANSVLFSGIDFSAVAGSSAPNTGPRDTIGFNIQLNKGSKLILNSSRGIDALEIKGATIHKDQLVQDIFTQDNTVVDIGSSGNAVDAIARRQNFNLLQIGTVTTANTNTNTGLKGENALFRVYANTKADQSVVGAGTTGARLGGMAASGGKGIYGHIYSDRIIVHD